MIVDIDTIDSIDTIDMHQADQSPSNQSMGTKLCGYVDYYGI